MSDTLIPVPKEWKERALIDRAKYEAMYADSVRDPEGFWRAQARRIDWIKPFTKVKDVDFKGEVKIRGHYDGTLNVSANGIDRHLAKRAQLTAILVG